MLRLAGERADGTILWMADERAIESHVVPRITAAHRRGRPVALCRADEVHAARAYAGELLGHADFSPNYVRLLEHGDAQDAGDTMVAGDEAAVLQRLSRYRDAGVTDLAARVVPLGDDASARRTSRRRTDEFLTPIYPTLAAKS